MTFEELYQERIKAYLSDITKCNILVSWISDISEEIDTNTIRIVLNKLPSINYKTSTIYSIQLIAICDTSIQDECFRILELYQADNFNKKFYLDSNLCFESYYSPSSDNSFINLGTNTGIEISMQGTIVVSRSSNEIVSVKIDNEEIDTLSIKEVCSSSVLSQPTINSEDTLSISDSRTYELMLTLPFTNNLFCQRVRGYMYGLISLNHTFDVALVYSDGFSISFQMIIGGVEKDSNNSQVSGVVVTLRRYS